MQYKYRTIIILMMLFVLPAEGAACLVGNPIAGGRVFIIDN